MPILANEWPADFQSGSDFVQIEDEEFCLASEPGGLIAIMTDNDQGYITVEAAKRLIVVLGLAIANSDAPRGDLVDTFVAEL